MEYTTLKNGLKVSKITFGCWELGGGQWEKAPDAVNIEAIRAALELGIQSFDTAEGYGRGHSEEVLAEGLGDRRRDVVVASKVAPDHLRPDDLRRSLEASLNRLKTDYLDIYYIHWPNPEIPLRETMTALLRAKEEGLIRAIGASNFSRALLAEAEATGPIDVIQPEYSLLCRGIENDVVPYCVERGIGILTYSSVAKGILTGVYHDGRATLMPDDFRAKRRLFLPAHLEAERPLVEFVMTLARQKGVGASEIALAWLLRRPGVASAIVGTQRIGHLRENARAVAVSLTADEERELDRLSREVIRQIDEASA